MSSTDDLLSLFFFYCSYIIAMYYSCCFGFAGAWRHCVVDICTKLFVKHCGKGGENGIENAEKARPDIGRARPEASRGVASKASRRGSQRKTNDCLFACLLPACLPSYILYWMEGACLVSAC